MASILIVDDSASTRIAMKVLLQREGHTVGVAEDGLQGLKAIETACPDAMVMDVIMPDMDGYTLLHRIRTHASPAIRALPVVCMTGRDKLEDLIHGLGVQGFVRKHRGCLEEITEILSHELEGTTPAEAIPLISQGRWA
jgi:CheY-like chemotaxis protein